MKRKGFWVISCEHRSLIRFKFRTPTLENYFLNDPELQDKVPTRYLSHKEVYEEAIRKSTVTLRKLKALEAQGRGDQDLYR